MNRGPRMTGSSKKRIDLARFTTAVRDGLTVQILGTRFGVNFTTAARLRKALLKEHPEWTPRPGTRTL